MAAAQRLDIPTTRPLSCARIGEAGGRCLVSQRRSEFALKPPISNCWNEYVRQAVPCSPWQDRCEAGTERRRSPLTPF
jgi:hypothetical protein